MKGGSIAYISKIKATLMRYVLAIEWCIIGRHAGIIGTTRSLGVPTRTVYAGSAGCRPSHAHLRLGGSTHLKSFSDGGCTWGRFIPSNPFNKLQSKAT